MPSNTTDTGARSNSIQEILSTGIQMEAARTQVWGQFPYVPEDGAIGGVDAGQTVTLRFQQRMPLKTDTINELADVTPVRMTDNKVSVTINEYGNAAQTSRLAEVITKGNLRQEVIDNVAENMVASLDRIHGRQFYEGQNLVFRANGVANRSDLDATNDVLSDSGVGMSFLARGTAALRAAKVPGFSMDGNGQEHYASVIHTALAQDLPETSGYLPALQYQSGRDTLFNGEMGDIRGQRFMESAQGKVYPGAGAQAQATTLNGSVSAGATSIVVTSATGIAVGDILTIGTIEDGSTVTSETSASTTENVQVTAVNGTTITVSGLGYSSGDISTPGLRYAHDSGEAVTEAALVAAIPLFGPKSVMKAYASEVGPFGEGKVSGPYDVLQRFMNFGWYALFGLAKTTGLGTVRLEVATRFPHLVINE